MALFDLIQTSPGFLVFISVVIGLLVGSFLNVVVHRLPKFAQGRASLADRRHRELAGHEDLAAEPHRRAEAHDLAPGRPCIRQERELLAPQGGGVRLSRAGRVGRGGRAVRRASLCAQPPAGSFAHRVVTVRKIQAHNINTRLKQTFKHTFFIGGRA